MKEQLHKNEKHLLYSSCGFKLFVGDEVVIKPINSKGYVQWIDLKKRLASISKGSGAYQLIELSKNQFTLEKTGSRFSNILFSKDRLKRIYNTLKEEGKVFFLYHYYKCNKEKIFKICKKLDLTKDQVRVILLDFKERGYL